MLKPHVLHAPIITPPRSAITTTTILPLIPSTSAPAAASARPTLSRRALRTRASKIPFDASNTTSTSLPSSLPSATTTSAAEAPTAPAGPSKEAVLARIARAKQYSRQPVSGADSGPATAADALANGTSSSSSAAIRAAALPRLGPTKVDWGAVVGFLDHPTPPPPPSSPPPPHTTASTAPLPYGSLAAPSQPPQPPATAPSAAIPEAAAAAAAAAEEADEEERQRQRFLSPAPLSDQDYLALLRRSSRTPGAGSGNQPAAALAGVLGAAGAGGGNDQLLLPYGRGSGPESGNAAEAAVLGGRGWEDMSMEEFAAAKEAAVRARGAEVITADGSYQPGGGVAVRVSMGAGAGMMGGPEEAAEAEARRRRVEEEEKEEARRREEEERQQQQQEGGGGEAPAGEEEEWYVPKVATWGIFPRPRNMSKAYGGGRNIRPGEELETPAQRAAREAAYAAALAAYRTKAGLHVDPEAEARAAQLYDEGMALFNSGQLRASYDRFEAALAAVPVKSKYGGLATLQKAILLDSFGRGEEAARLYRSIATHAVGQVSRRAKQLLFGFQAMTFMKAEQFSYGTKNTEYDKYFRRFAESRPLYVASEAERAADEAAAAGAAAVAATVLLAPVVGVLLLAAGK